VPKVVNAVSFFSQNLKFWGSLYLVCVSASEEGGQCLFLWHTYSHHPQQTVQTPQKPTAWILSDV
jgi:hypothetical protein